MRRIKLLASLTAGVGVAALTAVGAHAYGTYGKWAIAQVPYYVNTQNMDVSADAAEAAVQAAAAVWSTQSRASVSLYYGGRSTDTAITADGKATVIFRNASDGTALATTYSWYVGGRIIDADIIFWDGAYSFFTGTSGCYGGAYIEDVAVHEFGHVLGLNHSGVTGATMYPYYQYCTTAQRNLDPDDIAGIEFLYPPSSSAPSVTIANPINGSSGVDGVAMTFVGSASDGTEGDLTSSLVWRSSIDGQIGSGGSFSAPLSVGSHVITASATDSTGFAGSSQVSVTVAATCVRQAPTVTINPTPTSVAPGMTQSYTVNVVNNDSSSCGGSSFGLASTVPFGWTSALAATALTLDPFYNGSTTLNVTAPIDAPVQSYTLGVSATNNGAPSYSGSGFATESIVTGLSVGVSTSSAAYVTGNTVIIWVAVKQGSAPIASARVTVVMTKPNGTIQKWTPSTDRNGLAKVSFKIGSTFPRGTAIVNATTTKNGLSGAGAASFEVR